MSKTNEFEPTSEDTVQCFFFSSLLSNSDRKLWEQFCENVNNTIVMLSNDYIWHRDEFKVHLPIIENKFNDLPSHLISITNFAENLEDEWFIVYIVLELTRKYEHLIVKIKDDDGDFLLIEAAETLPTWIKPETSENRVFIYKGHIHIIPPHLISVETQVNLKQAIELITKLEAQTQAFSNIENAVLTRIGNYPEKIKENFHTTIVELPLHIAALLHLNPELVAPFVRTYCNHDAIEAKACKDVNFECCVNVEVKFTRFLYAMLVNAAPISIKHAIAIEKDKKKSLGFKLTCGYHLIMKSSKNIYDSKEYNQFIKSLERHGYFRNNIEGSISYQELLKKAKEFFASIECPVSLDISNKISKLKSSNEYVQCLEAIKIKNSLTQDLHEDNEDWLNIEPEKLNDLLHKRYGKKANKDIVTSYNNITSELTEFLKKTSDFEGVETCEDADDEPESIEFDPDEFTNCLEKMLNFLGHQGEDSDLESNLSGIEDDTSLSVKDSIDNELQLKLNCDPKEKSHNSKSIAFNLVQSMKEEQASSGPSSNLLKAVGLNKIDILDSDDDLD